MEKGENSWTFVARGLIQRFEVAAATGGNAVWNAKGSAACAKIVKQMAALLDNEIERRRGDNP